MSAEIEPRATLPWLVRLRWIALAGQLLALGVAHFAFAMTLVWWPLVVVAAVTALSNGALTLLLRQSPERPLTAGFLGGVLTLDILLLTVLLAGSGGTSNPFTVLFLVHITLSAVVLPARWTTFIAGFAIAGYGSLFFATHDPHAHHRATSGFDHHLQGMWVAFVLAAGLTAFFVRRVAHAIAMQREQIASLREASARNARLASLTTLAAGAAHELGSPLGTIAVAAHEAELALARLGSPAGIADDLKLIQLEVERCQAILGQMAARAAARDETGHTENAAALADRLRAHLGKEREARVSFRFPNDERALEAPAEELAQSIAALVRNGLEASPQATSVTVELARDASDWRVTVEDRGNGMSADVLAKVGEPFFTTKQPGRGLGLGVFLARAFAESRGGALLIESRVDQGTRAVLRLPASPALPRGAA